MHKLAATALLLFAFSSIASADVIYTYTGNPFTTISGPWAAAFGADPTEITAIIDVPNTFPAQPPPNYAGFACGSIGSSVVFGMSSGVLPRGFISASISDGLRTITPDVIELDGCGTTIMKWRVAGGSYALQPNSDDRAISTSNIVNLSDGGVSGGDIAIYTQIINFFVGPINFDDASGPSDGQWTAVVTPEVNTGALALISGSLLLIGYRRRAKNGA